MEKTVLYRRPHIDIGSTETSKEYHVVKRGAPRRFKREERLIVRLIGANFWQNCSIDEESMKLYTQVL
jgi:hypothetical protein